MRKGIYLLLALIVLLTLTSCAKKQEQKQELKKELKQEQKQELKKELKQELKKEQEKEINITLEDLRSIDKVYKFEKLFKSLDYEVNEESSESEMYFYGLKNSAYLDLTKDNFIVMGLTFNNEKTYNKIINAVKTEFEKVGENKGDLYYKDKENLTTISFKDIGPFGYKDKKIIVINSRRD